MTLSFSRRANSKLRGLAEWLDIPYSHINSVSLPAGFSCVGANLCRAYTDRVTGKLCDSGFWRCYAASNEAYSTNYRRTVWYNMDTFLAVGIRDPYAMAELIIDSVPRYAEVVRMMGGGDFLTVEMFEAFVRAALEVRDVVWYGYTKHYPAYAATRELWPPNFRMTYSHGGMFDHMADAAGIPQAYVVMKESDRPDLPLDKDDRLAYLAEGSFKLLVHGSQPRHIFELTR